jgi:hypothetical protein
VKVEEKKVAASPAGVSTPWIHLWPSQIRALQLSEIRLKMRGKVPGAIYKENNIWH